MKKISFVIFALMISYAVCSLPAQSLNDRLFEAVKANDTTAVKECIFLFNGQYTALLRHKVVKTR